MLRKQEKQTLGIHGKCSNGKYYLIPVDQIGDYEPNCISREIILNKKEENILVNLLRKDPKKYYDGINTIKLVRKLSKI